jgi:hypothetical protein
LASCVLLEGDVSVFLQGSYSVSWKVPVLINCKSRKSVGVISDALLKQLNEANIKRKEEETTKVRVDCIYICVRVVQTVTEYLISGPRDKCAKSFLNVL